MPSSVLTGSAQYSSGPEATNLLPVWPFLFPCQRASSEGGPSGAVGTSSVLLCLPEALRETQTYDLHKWPDSLIILDVGRRDSGFGEGSCRLGERLRLGKAIPESGKSRILQEGCPGGYPSAASRPMGGIQNIDPAEMAESELADRGAVPMPRRL